MKDIKEIYLPAITMADIGNLMMAVGKTVFDEIIRKIVAMGEDFENISYEEYKVFCSKMNLPIQDEKGYQQLITFLSGFIKGVAQQVENSEEDVSDAVAQEAVMELQKLYQSSIDEDELVKSIMKSKDPVKV